MKENVILLVEDNQDDVALVLNAFRHLDSAYRLVSVSTGRQAIEYLLGTRPYNDRTLFPFPRMVLLDLIMPDVDGFQFLEWLRKESDFKRLPVVVLASSHYSPDIKRAYGMGADSFITKPVVPGALRTQLKSALAYWAPVGRDMDHTGGQEPSKGQDGETLGPLTSLSQEESLKGRAV